MDWSFFNTVTCADLIRGMLTVDPIQRMTLDDVQAHPWVVRRVPFILLYYRSSDH